MLVLRMELGSASEARVISGFECVSSLLTLCERLAMTSAKGSQEGRGGCIGRKGGGGGHILMRESDEAPGYQQVPVCTASGLMVSNR